jgi:transposase
VTCREGESYPGAWQWALIEPLFETSRRADGRGRPWRDPRDVLNGVLWVLRTGAPWKDLPDRYPPYQTCHRRFQQWQRTGVLRDLLECLAEDLRTRGKLDRHRAPAKSRRKMGVRSAAETPVEDRTALRLVPTPIAGSSFVGSGTPTTSSPCSISRRHSSC